jgi:threonine/homoserine efflux transporter RhtA
VGTLALQRLGHRLGQATRDLEACDVGWCVAAVVVLPLV